MARPNRSLRSRLISLLNAYRRPGTPVFAYHYRRLPEEVLRPGNAGVLLEILADDSLPAKVRDHAAGALGQIGCREAVPALIDALSSAKTRRGAATALGLLRATEARGALAELAPKVGAARWAHEVVVGSQTADEVITSLREGQLRRIRPKIEALAGKARGQVSTALIRLLREQIDRGYLDHSHRWMVTSLQYLAPPEAAPVVADALRLSILTTDCCGCLCKRTTRTAVAIGSPEAIPALVEMIARPYRVQNMQQAAVAIEKIAKVHPKAASAALGKKEVTRLRSALRRIRRKTASTPRRPPDIDWRVREGSPRWFAIYARAETAVERVIGLANASGNAPGTAR